MLAAAHPATTTPAPRPATSRPYVLIPDGLIESHAHDPLAVGVYVAIARLALIRKGAVPLSATDLTIWAGNESEAEHTAIKRRIVKLTRAGWLVVTRWRAHKHALLPSWGRDRDGAAHPWDFALATTGRPKHVRGRRVSVTLLDTYLGQLKPQSGHTPALICRYFSCALLDLTDIGIFTIRMRTIKEPTARLTNLGLTGRVLPSVEELLEQATAGTLTTLGEDNTPIAVSLTQWGGDQLGLTFPEQGSGSGSGSPYRSPTLPDLTGVSPLPDAEKPTPAPATARNTWDVGIMESINHDSPSNVVDQAGGGRQLTSERKNQEPPPTEGTSPADKGISLKRSQIAPGACDINHVAPAQLSPQIIASHQALNPDRVIFPGEWWELLEFQNTHGAEQLLTWQARAARRSTGTPSAVHPGYYAACAAHATIDAYRPRRRDAPPPMEEAPAPDVELAVPTPAPTSAPRPAPAPALDPACDALLREMGIRERESLAGVPLTLIQQWAAVVDHAGLAARFDDPRAFAHHQLRIGQAPPPRAELDRWARIARKRAATESPPALTDEQVAAIRARGAAIQARAAAIAPADLTGEERISLLADLERGRSDAEALDLLHQRRAEAVRLAQRTPEQICADLVADLQTPFHRRLWPLLERLTLQVEGNVLRLICQHAGDLGTVQAQVAPIVRTFLSHTHWQPEVRVVAHVPPPPPKEAPPTPPDWITPHLWATLPGLMRTALLGSTLEDGELRCKAPALNGVVKTRFARELDALLAALSNEH